MEKAEAVFIKTLQIDERKPDDLQRTGPKQNAVVSALCIDTTSGQPGPM